jgi:NAD(P)-dependent dehydrogenase (short-subunit alcohol dehydrogenase family)
MKLENQTVVVVGGSSGMGLGVAEALAAEGARVIIASRTFEKCQQAASKIGESTEGRSIDMNSEESVRSFFESVGEIHHLIIPGSSVKTGPFKTTSMEDLMDSMRSKFLSPLLCARYARFKENASLTFFSGSLSRKPGNSSLLGSINAAVESLAKGLAIELAPVRVNVISPGLTRDTNAFNAMPEAAREQMFSGYAKKLPIGRVGLPKDFGQAAVFLTTCSFMTGAVIDIDGGGLLV